MGWGVIVASPSGVQVTEDFLPSSTAACMSFSTLIDPDWSKFGSTRSGSKGTKTKVVSMVTRCNRTDTERVFDMVGNLTPNFSIGSACARCRVPINAVTGEVALSSRRKE
jgi:hypothetical protein